MRSILGPSRPWSRAGGAAAQAAAPSPPPWSASPDRRTSCAAADRCRRRCRSSTARQTLALPRPASTLAEHRAACAGTDRRKNAVRPRAPPENDLRPSPTLDPYFTITLPTTGKGNKHALRADPALPDRDLGPACGRADERQARKGRTREVVLRRPPYWVDPATMLTYYTAARGLPASERQGRHDRMEDGDALVIAAVVAAGVGDVGVPGTAEGAGDQVADGGVGVGLVPGARPLEVFADMSCPARSAHGFQWPTGRGRRRPGGGVWPGPRAGW